MTRRMVTIIGLGGLAGSGKSTVAKYLSDNHHYRTVSFGGKLKDATALIFDLPRHLLEGDTEESREWRDTPQPRISDKTPRQILQEMGTQVGREIHPRVWLDAVELQCEKNMEEGLGTVITDVRFPNELALISHFGGSMWRVERPDHCPEWYKEMVELSSEDQWYHMNLQTEVHSSEWELAVDENRVLVDQFIFNRGTIGELHEKIERALSPPRA